MDLSFLFKAVGVVFRECLEAALIYGIITGFFRKIPGKHARELRAGRFGLALGIVASLALGAAFVGVTNFLSENFFSSLEIDVVFGGSLLMLYMVFWMSHHARTQKKEIEAELGGALQNRGILSLVGVVFVSTFREGMEAVVYLYSLTLENNEIAHRTMVGLSLVIGLGLATLIYQLIQIGSRWLSMQKVFLVTGAWLLFSASSLLMTGFDKMASLGFEGPFFEPLWSTPLPGGFATKVVHFLEGFIGFRIDPTPWQLVALVAFWSLVIVKDPLGLRAPKRAAPAPARA